MARTLTHPDSGQEIERNADEVALYEAQGWRVKPKPTPKRSSKPTAKK